MPRTVEHLVNNGDFTERLRRVGARLFGERNYRIDTEDAQVAFLDPLIPAWGDAWSAQIPALLVQNITTHRIGGEPGEDAEGGGLGWTRVQVEYETPSGSGSILPFTPGAAWCEIAASTRQVTVYTSAPASQGGPGELPHETRGQMPESGIAKDVGVLAVNVTRCFPNTIAGRAAMNTLLTTRILSLYHFQQVNNATIALPPVRATDLVLSAAAGQLRFTDFRGPRVEDQSLVVEYTLDWAPNHMADIELFNRETGVYEGNETSQPYGEADFAGLW